MELEPIKRLSKDIIKGAAVLGREEARFLVDAYYIMQEDRKRADNQSRALAETQEPNGVIVWFSEQFTTLENQIKRALDAYSSAHPVGEWARSVDGIGPVIAAGLLAHIDIHKAPTAGHIWSFAGLVDGVKWDKGEKRPWNAALKTLCWKIGESFVKVSGKETAFYGRVYAERKALEESNNEAGKYAAQAAAALQRVPNHAQKAIYASGKLPPGHLHARAKRYAVKLFLAHLHEIWYRHEFGEMPPNPYPIAILGHAHKISPPGMPE